MITKRKDKSWKAKTCSRYFFQALGQGFSWGTGQLYSDDSIDATLLECACCGMTHTETRASLQ